MALHENKCRPYRKVPEQTNNKTATKRNDNNPRDWRPDSQSHHIRLFKRLFSTQDHEVCQETRGTRTQGRPTVGNSLVHRRSPEPSNPLVLMLQPHAFRFLRIFQGFLSPLWTSPSADFPVKCLVLLSFAQPGQL